MRLKGKRVKRLRWVHTEECVVAVEVDAVIPEDDPSEPCYEPETVEFLREVERHAQAGDVDWLRERGRVYVALGAA
ncbi:MAG: hypothetical protein R6V58_08825 [Planctomycetota bacterium]